MIMRPSVLIICCLSLLIALSTGCTDDVGNVSTPDQDTETRDTSSPPPPDTGGDKLDTEIDTPEIEPDTDPVEPDVEPLPTNTQFDLCIMGVSEPTAPECQSNEILDFDWLPPGSLAERRLNIHNTGDARIEITGLTFARPVDSDTTLEAIAYRMVPDPQNPSRLIRELTPMPARILPDAILYIDVVVRAGATPGYLPADSLRIHTDIEDENEDFLIVEIPLQGEVRACATGTASCDGLAKTGCETNTTNDRDNCGACGNVCSFVNSDSACNNSVCEMIGQCAAGFGRCDKDPLAGCSTLLIDNFDHCGACDLSCARDNADGTCSGTSCQATCHTGFADCNGDLPQPNSDGCETNIYQDPDNCGGCGAAFKCDIPNAVNLCSAPGTCSFTECQPGFFDMDDNPANGCEYQCIPTPGDDRPADNTTFGYQWQDFDTNCDGIDGDASRAFFVATNGDDGNPGTRELPMRTIQAAINRIANTSTHIDQVYVSAGTYSEQITLHDGISIYGGFSRANGWERSPSHVTNIENLNALDSGNVIAIKGANISNARLQNFTVRAGGANNLITGTNQGASSYGVHCLNCTGLALVGNTINAGTGAPGQDGANSTITGANGNPGGIGGNGSHDGSTRGAGGSSGYSSCGRSGGAGGMGGSRGKNRGDDGKTGSVGTQGGSGGNGGDPGSPGTNGNNGTSGSIGTAGAGGTNTGSLVGNFWRGVSGSMGERGTHGNGGGGGGGGGGQGCTFCINGTGNGGGGGGGAGCGGYGGSGGGAGGGSFGIFLINSTNAILTNNTVQTAQGGRGGRGGNGASGGQGAIGGQGASIYTGEIGRGGNGGRGGDGGRGGYGGGGAGGPSIPVVTRQSTIQGNVETANALTPGSGGPGGTSTGNAGTSGLSVKTHAL